MNDDINYETFIFLSNKKFKISVIETNNSKIVYEEKKFIDNNNNFLEFEKFNNFLDDNIFKIEKRIRDFVKDVYLIIETEAFISTQVSIKNNNNGNLLTSSNLSYSINEAKDHCFKSLTQEKIIHIIINKYNIDNKDYQNLPINIKCNIFILDLTFICLPKAFIKDLENIMKKYQISISQTLSSRYIESVFGGNDQDLFKKARQLIEGFNENEVILNKKINKKKGFFEKFFNFFS